MTHVIPVNDLREHEDSVDCWCHPTSDDEAPAVILHHNMDGREFWAMAHMQHCCQAGDV